jgi:hypothetical protein
MAIKEMGMATKEMGFDAVARIETLAARQEQSRQIRHTFRLVLVASLVIVAEVGIIIWQLERFLRP